jgi:hypothetical protein
MCQKANGIHQCLGCGRNFCSQDTARHRQDLGGQLQELINRSEQWNSGWAEEVRRRHRVLQEDNDSVNKQIEDWERRSLARIKQAADEAREEARKLLHRHISRMQDWTLDTTPLQRARDTDSFLETDLRRWREELHYLKSKTNTFVKDIVQVGEEEPFISKFVVKGYFLPNEPARDPPTYLMVPADDYLDSNYPGKSRSGDPYVRYRDKRLVYEIRPENAVYRRTSSWI